MELMSLANAYDLRVLEVTGTVNRENSPCERRIEISFNMFDECLPKLGVFQSVFKEIRKTLYDGVYSFIATTGESLNTGSTGHPAVARVPYFVLLKRNDEERDHNIHKLQERLEELRCRMESKSMSLDQSLKENEIMRQTLAHSKTEISDLRQKMDVLTMENHKLLKRTHGLQESVHVLETEKERAIALREDKISCLHKDVSSLQKYAVGYCDLQAAFEQDDSRKLSEYDVLSVGDLAMSSRKEQLAKDLAGVNTLQSQLVQLRYRIVMEYDDFLREMESRVMGECSESLSEMEGKGNEDFERDVDLVSKKKKVFNDTVKGIALELSLLGEQAALLGLELEKERRKDSLNQATGCSSKVTVQPLDYVKIISEESENPFALHGQFLSRYGIQLFSSSNGGNSFLEVPGTSFCRSCLHRTLVCPHKVGEEEVVVQLLHQASHLKVVRPHRQLIPKRSRETVQQVENDFRANMTHARILDDELWQNFRKRFPSVDRTFSKELNIDRLLVLLHEVFAYIIWFEKFAAHEDHEVYAFVDYFWEYFIDRFTDLTACSILLLDVLTGLEKCSLENEVVLLFTKLLSGHTDAAMFRYVLLVNGLIDGIHWKNADNLVAFVRILYPFLVSEEVEQVKMAYLAFSGSLFSKRLVSDFIVHLVVKRREPRVSEILSGLPQAVAERGVLSEVEFCEAVEAVAPLASERQVQRLFRSSAKPRGGECLPSQSASEVISYLSLLQMYSKLRGDVKGLASSEGIEPRKSKRRTKAISGDASQETEIMFTMSYVERLAKEMGRLMFAHAPANAVAY